jgi:hypothetical protein
MTADELRALVTSDEVFATTLAVFLCDRHGGAALSWHPDNIRRQLLADTGVEVPQHNLDKLLAGIAVVTGDEFYRDPQAFASLTKAFAGEGFDPGTFSRPSAMECAWAVAEAFLLAEPEDEMPYSDEVRAFMGAVLREEGFLKPPGVLAMAQDFEPAGTVEFADDPGMFQTVWSVQRSRTDEVNGLVAVNLRELAEQLRSLPLQNGDAGPFVAKVMSALGREASGAGRG